MVRINAWKVLSIVMTSVLAVSCGSGGDQDGGQSAGSSGSGGGGSASVGASANALMASFADTDADILGVQLGMTPDEAHAALREARPDASVSEPSYVTMSIKTPVPAEKPGAYVQGIGINDRQDMVRVRFARPPLENVAMSIERNQSLSNADPQTSLEVYRDALIEKYGEPDEAPVSDNNLMHHFKWLFPSNRADCYPIGGLRSATEWTTSVADLPSAAERCASALVYTLTVQNGIVSRAQARLGNAGVIGLEIESHTMLQRELAEKAAAAEREAATGQPDL